MKRGRNWRSQWEDERGTSDEIMHIHSELHAKGFHTHQCTYMDNVPSTEALQYMNYHRSTCIPKWMWTVEQGVRTGLHLTWDCGRFQSIWDYAAAIIEWTTLGRPFTRSWNPSAGISLSIQPRKKERGWMRGPGLQCVFRLIQKGVGWGWV